MTAIDARAAATAVRSHTWRAARPDELDDIVCTFDTGLRLTAACAGACALFARLGFSLAPGESLASVPREVRERWAPVFDRVLTGESVVADLELAIGDRLVHYETKVQPLHDAAGVLTGIRAVARDITRRAAAEARLREIDARHALLLGATEDGVFDWDIVSGRIWHSPRANRLLGIDDADAIWHIDAWGERVHPDDRPRVQAALDAHFAHGAPYREVQRVRRGDGVWRWYETQGSLARDDAGHPVRMVGSFRDVTERVEAEEALLLAQARMTQAFRMARVGAWSFTPATGEIWWSEETYRLFERDPVVGAPTYADFLDYLHPDDRAPLVEAVDAALAGADRYEVLHRVLRPGREPDVFRGMGVVTRHPDGTVHVLAGTVIDVTAQTRTERALREAKELAEKSSRAKSDFLASMSHELRTPLNAVIGFAQRLEKLPAGAPLAERDRLFVSRIVSNGRHLLTVIDDILDIARIEAGRMTVERGPTDVGTLCAEVLAQLDGAPRAAGVALLLEAPDDLAPVLSDSARLRQVLVNLVGNALKFTVAGRVTVRVHADPATHRPLAIDVVDTGIGIAADRLPHIFDKFEQGDRGTHRRYGGTGLGLTICRELCTMMGHTLGVTSVEGEGSTFTIRLSPDDTPDR